MLYQALKNLTSMVRIEKLKSSSNEHDPCLHDSIYKLAS